MAPKKRVKPLHRSEGIIIKSIDYQDYDKILHVFTKDRGMCSLIAKKANQQRSRGLLPSAPLTHAEFLVEDPEKNLALCKEITPISHNLGIRKDFSRLTHACKMASALHDLLLPGKEAPLLFDLLKLYLQQLGAGSKSLPLMLSFFLKLLRHEGVFTLPMHCVQCHEEMSALYVSDQGCFCLLHAFDKTLYFSEKEQEQMLVLLYSRQLKPILEVAVNDHFALKIENLLKRLVKTLQ